MKMTNSTRSSFRSPFVRNAWCAVLSSLALMQCSCNCLDVREVYRAGGHFDQIGLGISTHDSVHFSEKGFDDRAFAKVFPALQRLRVTSLGFHNVAITDASVAEMRRLEHLTSLLLVNTKVTEGGLDFLKEMSHLEYVLFDIEVPPERLKSMRQAMPSAKISTLP